MDGVTSHPPMLRMGPSLSLRERGEVRHERSGLFVLPSKTSLILSSPRREERAHGQRPIAAARDDRAVKVRGGYSDGPGLQRAG